MEVRGQIHCRAAYPRSDKRLSVLYDMAKKVILKQSENFFIYFRKTYRSKYHLAMALSSGTGQCPHPPSSHCRCKVVPQPIPNGNDIYFATDLIVTPP